MAQENHDALRVGVYICSCGSNIGGVIDPANVAEFASHLPDVVVARDYLYMCGDPGQNMIKRDIRQYKLNRIVVAACSVRLHEPTFRACVAEAGLNPFLMEMANIREQDTWVHAHDPEAALLKAKEMVAAAVAKVRHAAPLRTITVPVTKKALVIGGGVAGISAALDLGDMNIPTYLVERELSIGGTMAQLNKTFPTMDCSI
jgi:heterodisulfide reductase subunit A